MKYLIVNGSSRKGNTWQLAAAAQNEIMAIDKNSKFRQIHISRLNLPFCTGCSRCFRLGNEKCPHYNIISEVIEAMDLSDGVIFVSATYNMRETAMLKNLFDHLCFMLHRPHFFVSKALIFTTAGGIGSRKAAESIKSTLLGIGFNRCYVFAASSHSWNDYRPGDKTLRKMIKTTGKFCRDVMSEKLYSPAVSLLVPYNLFRGMSLAYVKGSEYETKDGEYWTQEDRKYGVYDSAVPVPFYKKPIGQLFYVIGKTAGKMKSMQVTYRRQDE